MNALKLHSSRWSQIYMGAFLASIVWSVCTTGAAIALTSRASEMEQQIYRLELELDYALNHRCHHQNISSQGVSSHGQVRGVNWI